VQKHLNLRTGWVAIQHQRRHVVIGTVVDPRKVTLGQLRELRKRIDASGLERRVTSLDVVAKRSGVVISAAITRGFTPQYIRDCFRQFISFIRLSGVVRKPLTCRIA